MAKNFDDGRVLTVGRVAHLTGDKNLKDVLIASIETVVLEVVLTELILVVILLLYRQPNEQEI